MNFFQRLKAAIKITLGELPKTFFSGITGGGNTIRRASVEVDPYGNLAGWVYFAIDKVAQRVGGINLELYQLKQNGDLEQIDDHELLNILYRANPTQTKFDLFYLTVMYLRIWGSAPWYLERNNRKIINIWPMRPDLLKILQSKDDGSIIGYEYRVGTRSENFSVDEVIYIRKPSPQNPLRGFSPLFAASLEIDADMAAAIWNKHVLENSAEPGGVLTTDGALDDVQFEKVKNLWQERYAGPTNAGRTAILEGGLKFEKISQTQQELDFIESRKFNRDSILTMLGVPKALVIADDVNRANAETAERVFAKETVEPIMRLIIDQLNEFLVNQFGENLWLDFESPVSQDREAFRLEAQAGTNLWLTVNETREMINKAPLEGGDVLYMPLALVPTIGEGADQELEAKRLVTHIVKLKKSEGNFLNTKKKRIKQAILAKTYKQRKVIDFVTKRIHDEVLRIKNGKIRVKIKYKEEEGSDLTIEIATERKMYLKKLSDRTKSFKRVLKKYFNVQEKLVLENLKKAGEPKDLKGKEIEIKGWIDRILFDRKKQIAILVGISTSLYSDNIEEGAEDIAGLLGTSLIDIVGNAAAAEFLASKPIKFAEEVNDTTLQQLRDQLSEGVNNAESVGELGNRIASVFDTARSFRTETIARTEVGSALNFGRNEEMSEQGVEKKMWLAVFNNTRDDHAEASSQVVKINESFEVGGEKLEYPQDPSGSPGNIINCQCSVSPVLDR